MVVVTVGVPESVVVGDAESVVLTETEPGNEMVIVDEGVELGGSEVGGTLVGGTLVGGSLVGGGCDGSEVGGEDGSEVGGGCDGCEVGGADGSEVGTDDGGGGSSMELRALVIGSKIPLVGELVGGGVMVLGGTLLPSVGVAVGVVVGGSKMDDRAEVMGSRIPVPDVVVGVVVVSVPVPVGTPVGGKLVSVLVPVVDVAGRTLVMWLEGELVGSDEVGPDEGPSLPEVMVVVTTDVAVTVTSLGVDDTLVAVVEGVEDGADEWWPPITTPLGRVMGGISMFKPGGLNGSSPPRPGGALFFCNLFPWEYVVSCEFAAATSENNNEAE
jgi:hypothetical protein